jgi:hypothetical protein
MVTVGGALNVPQAERTKAAEQNDRKGFIYMGTQKEISYFWRGIRLDLLAISQK